jgi:FAD/FMN-containing dehydrogenase
MLTFDDTTTFDFEALRERIAGELYVPGDQGWDEARGAWNLSIDQRPAAVAVAESATDVVAIVGFAREQGLRVAPQGTGHNAGAFDDLADTVLLKTHRMREVVVDADAHRAQVQAGAVWADVVGPAAEHGLAPLAGSSHDVGVIGYTLGGGLSWLARKHGLAANGVRAIQVVTADGRLRLVDEHHDPDLFWALRGGGGSFGVVTAIEIELHPITEVYAGMLAWPWERAGEVLQAWREWVETVPDEVTSVGRLLQLPPLEEVPEFLRGRRLVVVEAAYLGDEAAGAELLAPLRELGPELDTFAVVPPPALLQLHMDPPMPVPGRGDGMMLDALTAEGVDALVAAAGADSGSPLLSVEVRHAGGALARAPQGAGALGTLDAAFVLFAVGMAPDPASIEAVERHVDVVKDAMWRWSAGARYLNFAERAGSTEDFFAPEAYRRLRAIKATVDPADVLRANHPIPPLG